MTTVTLEWNVTYVRSSAHYKMSHDDDDDE